MNVSARQLSETDFVPRLTELVASIPRGSLTLEITESLLIDDPERIAATLAALDEIGDAASRSTTSAPATRASRT